MQTFVSQSYLDMYFSYTSVLGSHTFFMLFLPLMYLIVDQKFGRVYVYSRLLTLQPYSFLRIGRNFCSDAQGTMKMKLTVLGLSVCAAATESTSTSHCDRYASPGVWISINAFRQFDDHGYCGVLLCPAVPATASHPDTVRNYTRIISLGPTG